jgi:hypothetical protein
MKNVVSVEWPNLLELRLGNNDIHVVDCRISKKELEIFITHKWVKLQTLWMSNCFIYLDDNPIGSIGTKTLVSHPWETLK